MKTVLHIVRADVRRWGLLIALSLVLTMALRLLEERAPVIAFEVPSRAGLLEVGQALFTLIGALLLVIIVAVVMQDTPVIGRRAFLLTRPIAPGRILIAKLVTLGIAFVAIPAMLDFVVLASRGVPPDLVALDAFESLFGVRLMLLLLLLLIAALTESLVAYLVVLVSGVAVVGVGLMWQAAFARPFPMDALWMAGDEPYSLDTFDATRMWVSMAMTLGAPLVLLARRRRRAAIVVFVVLLALAPIPAWPPLPRLAAPHRVEPPSWAARAERSPVVFSPQEASVGELWAFKGPVAASQPVNYKRPRTVHARLFFPAVPLDWAASVAELRSRFTLRDGSVIEGHGNFSEPLPRQPDQPTFSHVDAWKGMLGPAVHMRQVQGPTPPPRDVSRLLANLESEADVARVTTAPVRYDADFVFDLWRFHLTAVVPQQPVRIHLDHTVFEIMALRRDDPRLVTMLVRETAVSPWLRPAIQQSLTVVLKAPDSDEIDSNLGLSSAPGSPLRALSRIPLPDGRWLRTDHGSTWQIVSVLRDDVEPYAPGWIDRAQVALIERRYGGRIRRHLRIDELVVRDQGDARSAMH